MVYNIDYCNAQILGRFDFFRAKNSTNSENMCMEKKSELNPELFDMLKRGILSSKKIVLLIELKHMIDAFSSTNFVEEEKLEEIKSKFGVYPDIITWGDYFQTEVASRYFDKTDEEFFQIIETIRFDVISAHLIFSGKPEYFLDKVRGDALVSRSFALTEQSLENDESIHLEILLNYFENMKLGAKPLSLTDRSWYESFDLKQIAI